MVTLDCKSKSGLFVAAFSCCNKKAVLSKLDFLKDHPSPPLNHGNMIYFRVTQAALPHLHFVQNGAICLFTLCLDPTGISLLCWVLFTGSLCATELISIFLHEEYKNLWMLVNVLMDSLNSVSDLLYSCSSSSPLRSADQLLSRDEAEVQRWLDFCGIRT